jgi:pilus assembly protein FimV
MASCKRSRARVPHRRPRATRFGLIALLMSGLGGLAPHALGLGLGEIEIDSALNERLAAEIPLIDVGDLQPDEIRVTLASAEDFQRVGVERFFFLNDLRFRVEVGSDGGIVRVYSEAPVTEPYLNFLVQLQWPQGRLLKEYTLLLDPPTFSEARAPQVQGAVQAAPDVTTSGTIERPWEPVTTSPSVVEGSAAEPAPSPRLSGERVGDEYRMGDRPETLWSIASANRPAPDVSVQQTMLAIQRLNPDAFLGGNINRLKAGQTLRLPDEDEARAVSAAEALEQVAFQDQAWRGTTVPSTAAVAPTERAAIDATPETAEAATPAPDEGRLRIVAGEGDSVTGTPEAPAASAPAPEDQAALASALEERDRLSLEVADLTSQLDRERELAANQLAVKDRQLEVKDQQIAEMQAELARLREAGATEKQDQSVTAPATAWWQSPGMLGAGAGVVVLLLAAGLVASRRRRGAADEPVATATKRIQTRPAAVVPEAAPAAAEPAPTERVATAATGSLAVPAASAAALAAGAAAPVADAVVAEPIADAVATAEAATPDAAGQALESAGETAGRSVDALPGEDLVDVVGEADIYIAYGRYGQASGLLQGVLAEKPDRHDVRLKLLELFAETGDRSAFDRERAVLAARCDDPQVQAAAAALAAQFGGAGAAAGMQTLEDADLEAALDAEATAARLDAVNGDSAAGVPDEIEFELPEDIAGEADAIRAEVAGGGMDSTGPELSDVPLDTFEFELERQQADSAAALQSAESLDLESELDSWTAGRLEDAAGFDRPLEATAVADLDVGSSPGPVLDDALGAPRGDLLGGDLGIDFRLEEEDLASLDENELAMEMDGLPASTEAGFDFVDEADSTETKLDLARAYGEMGDPDGAREILLEVLKEGTEAQRQVAQELLEQL